MKQFCSKGFAEQDPVEAAMKRIELLNSIQKTNHETIDKPKNNWTQFTI